MPRRNHRLGRKGAAQPTASSGERRYSTDPDYLARQLVRRGLASPAILGPTRHPVLPKETHA